MNRYAINFEISLTGARRTALVNAETPGEAVQLVLADHGAICLLHLEHLPPARGVAPFSGAVLQEFSLEAHHRDTIDFVSALRPDDQVVVGMNRIRNQLKALLI